MSAPSYMPGPNLGAVQQRWNPVGSPTPLTAAYTAAAWDFALFDASTAVISQTLPANAPKGSMWTCKRVDPANTSLATTGSLSIVPPAGETIRNGLSTNTSIPITGQDQTRTFLKESATQWTAVVDDPLPSLYPRLVRNLATQVAIKSGDTIQATAGTAEQPFASTLALPANTLTLGAAIILFIQGTYQQTNLGPTQQPRVRIGPSATAAASRPLALNFGPISGLLATATPYMFTGQAMFTVDSISGTSAVLRSGAQLTFVSQSSGQATTFLAGAAAGSYTTVTIDPTVTNLITLSVQFSAATANNYTVLQQFLMLGAQAATGSN